MDELHICLWGEHNFRNFTPALASEHTAELLVLADASQTESIKRSLSTPAGTPHIIPWSSDANPPDFARLESYLAEQKPHKILLNLSCGERLSAMQLLSWGSKNNYECYLIDDDDQQHWLIPSDRPSNPIPDLAKLKEYFRIHQIDLLSHGMGMPIIDKLRKLADLWVMTSNGYDIFRSLNWLASAAEPNHQTKAFSKRLKQDWHNDKLYPLLLDLQEAGLAECHGSTVIFPNEASRFFCNGGWLELFVYEQIRQLRDRLPQIQDVRLGLEISQAQGVKNELDVVFLADNRLHLLEVKTSYLADKIGKTNQLIYKLEALSNALGEEVKGMVISLFDLPESSERRAGVYDLRIVSGSKLRNLSAVLKKWINNDKSN